MSLLNLIKNKQVEFQYYCDGLFWYKIKGTNFAFPVPVEDVGSGTMLRDDKAVVFMKWIGGWIKARREFTEMARGPVAGSEED